MALFSFSRDVGIDLGTSRTRIYLPYNGIVFDEPSALAFEGEEKHKKLVCVGDCAHEMVGRAPDSISIHNIVSHGVIQDERIAEQYLYEALKKVRGMFQVIRNDILISTPTEVTSMEERAVIQTCKRTGARNVFTEQKVILAAFGVGMDRDELHGRMITDIGAGLTEAAVISLGGMSGYSSTKIGGNDMDASVVRHIQRQHHLLISEDVARQVKETIGSATLSESPSEVKVKGSDVNSRLPRIIRITSNDIAEAVQGEIQKILETIVNLFQNTAPELASDIIEGGIILTGGVAKLNNIAQVIERQINVPVYVADEPEYAVIRGIGRSIQTGHLDFHRRALLSK